MASNNKNTGFAASTSTGDRSYFETQRAALLGEIGVSLEHTLSAINKLNRSLEGVIAVGNEFGSVEALWSTFETVMGHDANATANTEGETEGDHDESKVRQEQGYERRDERGQGQERNRSESEHERR